MDISVESLIIEGLTCMTVHITAISTAAAAAARNGRITAETFFLGFALFVISHRATAIVVDRFDPINAAFSKRCALRLNERVDRIDVIHCDTNCVTALMSTADVPPRLSAVSFYFRSEDAVITQLPTDAHAHTLLSQSSAQIIDTAMAFTTLDSDALSLVTAYMPPIIRAIQSKVAHNGKGSFRTHFTVKSINHNDVRSIHISTNPLFAAMDAFAQPQSKPPFSVEAEFDVEIVVSARPNHSHKPSWNGAVVAYSECSDIVYALLVVDLQHDLCLISKHWAATHWCIEWLQQLPAKQQNILVDDVHDGDLVLSLVNNHDGGKPDVYLHRTRASNVINLHRR